MDRDNGSNPSGTPEQAQQGSGDDRGFDNIFEALGAFADEDAEAIEQPGDREATTDDDQAEAEDHEDGDEEAGDEEEAEAVDEDDEGDEEEDSEGKRVVTLPTGEEVPEDELVNGYFRQQDYTRKTQALAEEREKVGQIEKRYRDGAQSLLSLYQKASQFLEQLVPPEPDLQLAQSDPGQYQYQRALRENAMRELQSFLGDGQQAQQAVQQMSNEDAKQFREQETAKLTEALPDLKEPAKLEAFYQANRKTAQEFGFSEQEIADVSDSRILQLVYYARIGKRAATDRKAAKERLAEAPRKGSKPKSARAPQSRNRQAMQRLAKSGSFEDAMKTDFD